MVDLTAPLTDVEVRKMVDDAFSFHVQNAVGTLMGNPLTNQNPDRLVTAVTNGRKLHQAVVEVLFRPKR